MPFKSKKQLRWMAAAEGRGDVPKGTFKKWKNHTPNLNSLPESVKTAYEIGAGLAKLAVQTEHPDAQAGKETRLKRNHLPHDFFAVRRAFERAALKKKEVGTHVAAKDPKDDAAKR